ncbi:MAG: ChbG/HpnK family deacetylase [Lachnospiraceae bacterium]|nr:ChbG/HpnK family deacetylase [Lachnospiraceae bacterium]
MKEIKVWYHADDFGVSIEQSERILACYTDGALNSISILPNVPDLGGVLALLEKIDKDHEIRRVMHLNFVEGKPLAGAAQVPLLVDDTGYFDKSFGTLLRQDYTAGDKKRAMLKKQICAEIRAQLRAVTTEYDFGITAIDAHQHYHMIPMIFDCLMEVLEEEAFSDLTICQIRIPVDPLKPAFSVRNRSQKILPINLVKWLLLKMLSIRAEKRLREKGVEVPVFFGILYTCEMKWDIVNALLPKYKAYTEQKGASLELMFHPGNLTAEYELPDQRRKELRAFYMSDNRFFEAECLKTLKRTNM